MRVRRKEVCPRAVMPEYTNNTATRYFSHLSRCCCYQNQQNLATNIDAEGPTDIANMLDAALTCVLYWHHRH